MKAGPDDVSIVDIPPSEWTDGKPTFSVAPVPAEKESSYSSELLSLPIPAAGQPLTKERRSLLRNGIGNMKITGVEYVLISVHDVIALLDAVDAPEGPVQP